MSDVQIHRTVVNGFTIRFYHQRRDAIRVANAMTVAASQQHNAVYAMDQKGIMLGWLVQNAVTKVFYDYDGLIPGVVVGALKFRD